MVQEGVQRAAKDLRAVVYKDIDQRYCTHLVKLKTTEMAAGDLEKYHKVLSVPFLQLPGTSTLTRELRSGLLEYAREARTLFGERIACCLARRSKCCFTWSEEPVSVRKLTCGGSHSLVCMLLCNFNLIVIHA